MKIPETKRIPLTLITGFLGAGKPCLVTECTEFTYEGVGKSTLLQCVFVDVASYVAETETSRRILTEKHGFRIAVIMNEFGDTAVSKHRPSCTGAC